MIGPTDFFHPSPAPHFKTFPVFLICCMYKIYIHIILPVILYGCERWSLTLREERRLRVFENRVLRRIFGPKRDKESGVEMTS
jgi:hypothetical protein